MTKLEMACIIIGFIMFFNSTEIDGKITDKELKMILTKDIISRVVCGLMILLPLYFRYWR